MRTTVVACLAAGAALLFAGSAHGQASQAEMAAFPMPPAQGYEATAHFSSQGGHGYFEVPSASVPSQGSAAADLRYVRYTGVAGKDVWVYGAWGSTPIPPATRGADACGHAHTSYGVWAKYVLKMGEGEVVNWSFLGGGGMSGVRRPDGRCVLRVDNPLREFDPRYGWGEEALHLDFRGVPWVAELVLGVLSNTHGWGSCTVPPGTFRACHEPSWAIGFSVPG